MPASISTVRKDAVLEDGRSTLVDDEARTAVGRIRVPTTLLWAPRGLLDQAPGLLSPELVVASLPERRRSGQLAAVGEGSSHEPAMTLGHLGGDVGARRLLW